MQGVRTGDVFVAFALDLNYVSSIVEKVGNTFAKIIRGHKSKYREGEVYCLQHICDVNYTAFLTHGDKMRKLRDMPNDVQNNYYKILSPINIKSVVFFND